MNPNLSCSGKGLKRRLPKAWVRSDCPPKYTAFCYECAPPKPFCLFHAKRFSGSHRSGRCTGMEQSRREREYRNTLPGHIKRYTSKAELGSLLGCTVKFQDLSLERCTGLLLPAWVFMPLVLHSDGPHILCQECRRLEYVREMTKLDL